MEATNENLGTAEIEGKANKINGAKHRIDFRSCATQRRGDLSNRIVDSYVVKQETMCSGIKFNRLVDVDTNFRGSPESQ